MRLLLTRAETDADRTRVRLEALGHEVTVSPVIEIIGTGAGWPTGVVDAAVATSGHALSARLDGPAPEVCRLLPLFLVGARTAEAAQAQGLVGPATVAKNAGALVKDIVRTLGGDDASPKRIVYLAGRDRKPDMEAALGTAGHRVEVVEVYEARAIDGLNREAAQALRRGGIDAILHFSRRSVSLLIDIASKHDLDIKTPAHLCLSEDVATSLREAGAANLHVAKRPNEDALLDLLAESSEAGA